MYVLSRDRSRLRRGVVAAPADAHVAQSPAGAADKPRASPLSGLHVGSLLLASVLLGFGIGWWLDGYFATTPWLTVASTLLFIVAGLYQVVREASR